MPRLLTAENRIPAIYAAKQPQLAYKPAHFIRPRKRNRTHYSPTIPDCTLAKFEAALVGNAVFFKTDFADDAQ